MKTKKTILSVAAMAAVLTVGMMAGPRHAFANIISATFTRDADAPARQPFQASVLLALNEPALQTIAIPAGKRLVVEYVSFTGSAFPLTGIQPMLVITTKVAGGPLGGYYLDMTQSQ